jgi:putative membrane protein insertion efficiency factor
MQLSFRKVLATVLRLPATVSIGLIRVYQKTISPDHGFIRHFFPHGYCPHQPTCSEYAIKSLVERPWLIAVGLIIGRIVSCNPWTKPSDERLKASVQKVLRSN